MRRLNTLNLLAGLVATITFQALMASTAAATTVTFECITDNNAGDCAIGEAQLSVDVAGVVGNPNQVLFTFANSGPDASLITDVYFDDGTLLGIAGLIDSDDNYLGAFGDPGVDFSQGAAPPNLPGGNSLPIPFETTAGFLADADPPPAMRGVDPGETLGVVFNLQGGGTLADILLELTNGDLRIGIHVQGYASGGSESFVNFPIPEPGTGILLMLGLAGLARSGSRPQRA